MAPKAKAVAKANAGIIAHAPIAKAKAASGRASRGGANRPPMTNPNPVPPAMRCIERDDDFDDGHFYGQFVRAVVDYLEGCHSDEICYWLGVFMTKRPGLLAQVTRLLPDRYSRQQRILQCRIRNNLAIAVMPNGIVRAPAQ